MADNFTANPGAGGDTFASDDIGGVQYPRSKVGFGADGVYGDVHAGNPLPTTAITDAQLRAASVGTAPEGLSTGYWPSYKGIPATADQRLNVDPGGALVTRGAVTTDEGTFRVNFANTSIAVSLGSVTLSGLTVTGSGFLAADVHMGDYFKFDADGDTAWMQIESVDSDTQITLAAAYPGAATSGAASRALVFVNMQNGAGYSVASGQLTMTTGTTSGASAIVGRVVDYAPIVFRAGVSISQRIANQELRIGFAEPVTAGAPRWFARFNANGTTNTTIVCESGRNPTTAPSAAETQSTTVTLPNGLTTAQMVDYRVEILTESVRFYINKIMVAEHYRVLPSQSDIMAASVRAVNTAAAGSSTSVVVDYLTSKNHNKLEVGIMSDAEQIVAQQPDLVPFNYTQAGVIAINTVLLSIDCLRFRFLTWQCTSMGTTGVVTPEWSADGATWVGATFVTPAGATATTFNAAGMWQVPVIARYFRLRLSTATTAGTTTITLLAYSVGAGMLASQNVQGTVTANIGTGSLAAGTNAIGDVGLQGRANATGAMSTAKILAAATTNATSVKATAGRVFGWSLTNTTAAVKVVRLYNLAAAPTVGTSVPAYNIVLPANATVNASFPVGIAHATGIAYAITNAIADLDATAVAANDVIGAIYWL